MRKAELVVLPCLDSKNEEGLDHSSVPQGRAPRQIVIEYLSCKAVSQVERLCQAPHNVVSSCHQVRKVLYKAEEIDTQVFPKEPNSPSA